nr:MAG TPA: hypothetical protein [Caudoviricetes sp.]
MVSPVLRQVRMQYGSHWGVLRFIMHSIRFPRIRGLLHSHQKKRVSG